MNGYTALAVVAFLTGCSTTYYMGDPERMHIPDSRVVTFHKDFHATLHCPSCEGGGKITKDKVAILGCDGPCGG